MNQFKRNILRILSCAMALCLLALCAGCGKDRDTDEIVEEITVYYGAYGDRADKTLEERLKELDKKDPELGKKWRSIIGLWKQSNNDLTLHYDVLPDGLPETDEFCMVVLGYQLNADGTMRDELLERLRVAKASAEKYPNAYIVCTGGPTAYEDKTVTEAGRMAEWLTENGIDGERVIVEDRSLTTAQNAKYSLAILSEKYPRVTKLAIISSDYHIATGHLLFGAESILMAERAGEEQYEVISNAAWKAPSGMLSAMFQAGALTELSGDRETAWKIYYNEYDIHSLPPIED